MKYNFRSNFNKFILKLNILKELLYHQIFLIVNKL